MNFMLGQDYSSCNNKNFLAPRVTHFLFPVNISIVILRDGLEYSCLYGNYFGISWKSVEPAKNP